MTLSLGEVEALATKAARGSGYDWGHAKLAGFAVRALYQNECDGLQALLPLLDMGFGAALREHLPGDLGAEWNGPNPLCPIGTGACFTDIAHRVRKEPISIVAMARPQLFLPFVAQVAKRAGVPLAANVDGTTISFDTEGGFDLCSLPDQAGSVLVEPTSKAPPKSEFAKRANPDKDTLKHAEEFAARTYAPATEESRRLGAGSNLSDND